MGEGECMCRFVGNWGYRFAGTYCLYSAVENHKADLLYSAVVMFQLHYGPTQKLQGCGDQWQCLWM